MRGKTRVYVCRAWGSCLCYEKFRIPCTLFTLHTCLFSLQTPHLTPQVFGISVTIKATPTDFLPFFSLWSLTVWERLRRFIRDLDELFAFLFLQLNYTLETEEGTQHTSKTIQYVYIYVLKGGETGNIYHMRFYIYTLWCWNFSLSKSSYWNGVYHSLKGTFRTWFTVISSRNYFYRII